MYIPEAVCNEEGSTYLDPKTAAINYQQSKKRTYIYIYKICITIYIRIYNGQESSRITFIGAFFLLDPKY